MVTRFAWMAHRLQSSNRCTMKSSVACRPQAGAQWLQAKSAWACCTMHTSCMASRPSAVHLKGSGASSLVISRTCGGRRSSYCMQCAPLQVCQKHCEQQTYQPGKGQLAQEQLCAPLKLADFPESDCSGPEAVRLALGARTARCTGTSCLSRTGCTRAAQACRAHPPALPFLPVPGVPVCAATTLSCTLAVFLPLLACTPKSGRVTSQRGPATCCASSTPSA